jgi:hypothetical protein
MYYMYYHINYWLVVSIIFYFPFHIWDNPSHWLSYFSRWLKPPTRLYIYDYICIISLVYLMTSHCVPVFGTFYQSIYCTNCKINCMPVKPVWKGWIMLYIIELDGKMFTGNPIDGKNPWVSGCDFPQTNPMITSSRILTTLWRWLPHRPRQLHMVDIADESGASTFSGQPTPRWSLHGPVVTMALCG